ncbi:MAG: NADH:flavin oxidoreductase [Deltaproteobacteria bacterium]|nr:NADH:flavin oxidoreductase [Deltaproteobacteria bacterium]
MKQLFETSEINGMILKNRFIRSATWEGMATREGMCTPRLIELVKNLAKGEIGLIVSSSAYVQEKGRAVPTGLLIDDDQYISGLKKMVDAVHAEGVPIVGQIGHVGLYADPRVTHDNRPFAPSVVPTSQYRLWLKLAHFDDIPETFFEAMTHHDIQGVVEAYGEAANRVKKAGFDGVQIHACHGYLLNQFLGLVYNKREDEYGGTLDNRSRFLLEVVKHVRERIGNSYPMMIKMNCRDFMEGGPEIDDYCRVAEMLEEAGIDAIEVTGGTFSSGSRNRASRRKILTEEQEAYFRREASAIKKRVGKPVILTGGIRSFHIAEQIVADNEADYIGICRPFIREPDLIKRWKSGDHTKAACVSENLCAVEAAKGNGIYCVVEKREREKESQTS